MERPINNLDEKNQNIKNLIDKLANNYDIQSYKNKLINSIEESNKRIFNSNKIDQKSYLLMTLTYYLQEFEKIEKTINSEGLLNNNINLTKEKYIQLLSYFNLLLYFEEFYINKYDIYRSLQIQSKIINIIKTFLISKIGKD